MATSPSRSPPNTDRDWTVHALNIHGSFLERWCRSTLEKLPGWKVVRTNHPVEFPPPNGPFRGKESSLDILAEYSIGETIASLTIECKKNNPNFASWVFFPKTSTETFSGIGLLKTRATGANPPRWSTATGLGGIKWPFFVTDEGREVRGTYHAYSKGDKTKISNAAIVEACYQVALATQAVFVEEVRFSDALSRHPTAPMPYATKVLIPTVITTADLKVCEFDPKDVQSATGEIAYDRMALKQVDALVFEYALPRHLQNQPADLGSTLVAGALDSFTRMHILVVHSPVLAGFIKIVEANSTQFHSMAIPVA